MSTTSPIACSFALAPARSTSVLRPVWHVVGRAGHSPMSYRAALIVALLPAAIAWALGLALTSAGAAPLVTLGAEWSVPAPLLASLYAARVAAEMFSRQQQWQWSCVKKVATR